MPVPFQRRKSSSDSSQSRKQEDMRLHCPRKEAQADDPTHVVPNNQDKSVDETVVNLRDAFQ